MRDPRGYVRLPSSMKVTVAASDDRWSWLVLVDA